MLNKDQREETNYYDKISFSTLATITDMCIYIRSTCTGTWNTLLWMHFVVRKINKTGNRIAEAGDEMIKQELNVEVVHNSNIASPNLHINIHMHK